MKTVLFFVLIYVSTSIVHGADISSRCGDDTWVAFEDEKCVKLIQTFAMRDIAEGICNKESSKSSVPTLSSESNDVWIGAQRRSDGGIEFDWNDGSIVEHFTNWAIGHPTNDIRRSCVYMQSEFSRRHYDMKWVDSGCTSGKWFICQKLQTWSLQHFQQVILDARREKQLLTNQLDRAKIELKDLQDTFTIQMANVTNQLNIANIERRNLQDNPIPIGFIYVQLRNQPAPNTLWTTVTWTEITADYAGLFFRAVGEGSAAFGTIQNENSSRLHGVFYGSNATTVQQITVTPNEWSTTVSTGASTGPSTWGLRFLLSSGENRPRNTAIRIWIRSR